MNEIDVSILIVSFNTRDLTLACIESIFAQTRQARFEIIVVDNQSPDGSADAIAARFPQVNLIRAGSNLGFARANNLAAAKATGRFILLLNPDTLILDGAIDRIIAFAGQHPDAGIWGGRTFFGDMTLNRTSCHGRPTPWSLFCMGTGLSSLFRGSAWLNPESLGAWPRDTVRRVDCVTGCFLLIDTKLWLRLNGFDEAFFIYGEETDLCIRAGKSGAYCLLCPDAKLIHLGGRSESVRADKMVKLFRAKTQLFEKHWRPSSGRYGYAMLCTWAWTRFVALSLLGRRTQAAAWHEIFRRRSEYAPAPHRSSAGADIAAAARHSEF